MVNLLNFEEPEINRKEILRYAGVKGNVSEVELLLDECLDELRGKLTYRVCYDSFKIVRQDEAIDMGFAVTRSGDIRKYLEKCENIVLFAATLGVVPDRLITKYSRISPAKAYMFQAISTERIEALCDAFCGCVQAGAAEAGKAAKTRFSPGYGDLPLGLQKEIFAVLDCPRKLGLTLNDSLLMSPSKSVTAIVGIFDKQEKK